MQTRDSLRVLKLEADTLGVGAQCLNAGHLEVDPSLVTTNKDLRALRRLGIGAAAVAVETNTQASETDRDVDGGQRLLGRGF